MNDLALEPPTQTEPEGPGFESSSQQPQVVAHQQAELPSSTTPLVHAVPGYSSQALHVHFGLGQFSPLPCMQLIGMTNELQLSTVDGRNGAE